MILLFSDGQVPRTIVAHEDDVVLRNRCRSIPCNGLPAPKLSMIFMACAFLISISPATGTPRAVSRLLPRMIELMASSLAGFPEPEE